MKTRFFALTVGLVTVFASTVGVLAAKYPHKFFGKRHYVKSPVTSEENIHISLEEATKIALEKAGVNENEAKFLKTDLDRDDGVLEYEIEFEADGFEYEIEVSADGNILSFHKEKDEWFFD